MKSNLSEMQMEIIDSPSAKIIVDAGSGSGKTRVLTERVRRILSDGVNPKSVVVITFTNMAASELYERLSDVPKSKDCFIGTIHSYANKLLKKSGYDFEIFSEYYQTLFMTELLKNKSTHYYCTIDDYMLFLKYDKMISSGRMSKSDLLGKFTDYKVYDELMCLLGKKENPSYKETVVTLCKKNNVITFDELIELATKYFEESNTHLEYLFVDELQDIGYLEYNFLLNLNSDNYFFIGDDYQCQPSGTEVMLSSGYFTGIENINVGDCVMSVQDMYSFVLGESLVEKRVTNIQKSISDTLITVHTISGKESSYTPNHKCVIVEFDSSENCNLTTKVVTANDLNVYNQYLVSTENGYFSLEKIVRIDKSFGCFDVYCLEVEDTGIYVADKFLTHNSIFSFKGGDVNIFLSLMHNNEWKPYYLTENYRTSKSILMYANTIVNKADNIIKKDVVYKNQNKGLLEFKDKRLVDSFIDNINDNEDWFILTRTNKEMVQIDTILSKKNKNHFCFKQSNMSSTKLKEILSKPCIKVMTIHSAKGLECDNVALYGKLPVNGKGESEELKVYYVGITRSKERCVIFV